jgi:hypothetical protein
MLQELFGIQPVKVIPEAAYANWDLDGEAALVLFGRAGLTTANLRTAHLRAPDGTLLELQSY